MPRRTKRPCSHPGCPELTEGKFCEKHAKEENKHYRSMTEILLYAADTKEHGNVSATVMVMSSYEEFMIILTVALLRVAILDIKNKK